MRVKAEDSGATEEVFDPVKNITVSCFFQGTHAFCFQCRFHRDTGRQTNSAVIQQDEWDA